MSNTLLDKSFVETFVHEWIVAWNNHDLTRILAHYSDDFSMTSPLIVQLRGIPSGTLHGKAQVAEYWAQALQLFPDLQFTCLATGVGVDSISVYYQSPRGMAMEVLHFNALRQVHRAFAHYAVTVE